MHGSAGPSSTDSEQWRSLLLRYGNASACLREAIATPTRRYANELVPWGDQMRAFLAHREIALDKCPGVQPIGVGECRQRMEVKTMALVEGIDVQDLCGADQVCAGILAGNETVVHTDHERNIGHGRKRRPASR